MMLIDLQGKGSVVRYKGAVDSLKSIACHKTEPYIVSVGFVRHLLVCNLNSRAVLQNVDMHVLGKVWYVICIVKEKTTE